MNRTKFLSISGFRLLTSVLPMNPATPEPEAYRFKDDGLIPNSTYPLLLYRNAFRARGSAGAVWLEEHFAANGWTNSWRNGVFPYHHYHSTTHEVLGIYGGSAELLLGGEQGQPVSVKAGDVIVIPAGVGHKNLKSSSDFSVVGAYPDGRSFDVLRGKPGERPDADKRIAAIPTPKSDPLLGKTGGLTARWK